MLKEKVNRVKHTTIKHLGYSLTPPFPELQFPGPDFCGRSWELGLLNQRQRCCFREPVMGRMEGLGRRPGKSSVTLEDWSNQCERFFSGDMGGDSEPGRLWKEMLGLWDLTV